MRVIVIGAGHNGLTAAFYLAKAGLEPMVLEQAETIGGGAVTSELHPGFRCPTLNHYVSLRSDILADMQLARRGIEFLQTPVEACAPAVEGPAIVVYRDDLRTTESLRAIHAQDAERYPMYRSTLADICRVLGAVLTNPTPDIDTPDMRDAWNLLKTGRLFRALGVRKAYALLRWAPMPVSDFVNEWFESDLLRAMVAAPAISGTMYGPRSAGSALVLLLREATRTLSGGHAAQVKGGPGALTQAMADAARTAGATIHTGTRVERVIVSDGRVSGVVAAGRELPAAAIVSAIDPKTTFLNLVDPVDISPDFRAKISNYRANGTLAKVNLALAALPSFTGLPKSPAEAAPYGASQALSGRIHIGPDLDYLERAFDHAKYGEISDEPWLDVAIPSVLDPGLAPAGAHVMSVYTHYAPYRLRSDSWPAMKEAVLSRVMSTLERFAPGTGKLVVAADVITPPELETHYGFHGGHVFHGELALDQLAITRPLLGFSRYQSPIQGLFMCSAGTHPGGFMSGGSGRMVVQEIARTLAR
jgi:phytoene dehydrogenase-like protein